MKKEIKYLVLMSFVFLLTLQHAIAKEVSQLKVDTPLKAAVFYFPSPAVMRCLNHSDIPRTHRKAHVKRQISFIGKPLIEENINVTENSKGPFFDLNKEGKVKPSFLFGLEDLIGVQRKIHILDMIGNQDLDFEVFLRTTKGMIGNLDYKLDLFGQDKVVNGAITYFLKGNGNLGENKITVFARETEKDSYYLREDYGRTRVISEIKVFD